MKSILIINKIENYRIFHGENPKSIIAEVIYISAKLNNEKITQRIISHHIGVIEETIRKRYKDICKLLRLFYKIHVKILSS